jgi:methionyl-tRNA formyltransferase
MDAGLDTGPILTQRPTPIRPDDTAQTMHDRLAELGATLLLETLPGYVLGEIKPRPQPAEGVSHAPKIKKDDGQIDWTLPARGIWNRIRAFTPWPGAFTHLPAQPAPQLLKIWQAEVAPQVGAVGEVLSAGKDGIIVGCGEEALRVLTLQREGGRRMSAREFLAGHSLSPGQVLASKPPPTG